LIGLDIEVTSIPRFFEADLILESALLPSWYPMVPAESI
jgi:hypothetical protein